MQTNHIKEYLTRNGSNDDVVYTPYLTVNTNGSTRYNRNNINPNQTFQLGFASNHNSSLPKIKNSTKRRFTRSPKNKETSPTQRAFLNTMSRTNKDMYIEKFHKVQQYPTVNFITNILPVRNENIIT